MSLASRLFAIVVLVLGSVAVLVPTAYPPVHAAAPWAPRLHLGVDLQGGIGLVLRVEADASMQREVAHDLRFLREHLTEIGMLNATARPVGIAKFEVASAEETLVVAELVDDALFGMYRHIGSADGVHRFELRTARRSEILENATNMYMRDVLPGYLWCHPAAKVERFGDLVSVELPGAAEVYCAN